MKQCALPECLHGLWVILAAAVAALAQAPQGPLSLDECIQLALSAPSSITAVRHQAKIARYEVVQAKANFLPQTSLANSFVYNSANPEGISFVSLNGLREYSSLATMGVDIDTSGRLRAQLARAQVLLGSILLIFIILVFEFRSFSHPIAILVATILCGFGALLALWITKSTLNVSSFMGAH